MVCEALHAVGADGVLKAMAQPGGLVQIEVKRILLPGAVEIVEDAKAFGSVQLFALGAHGGKVGGQIRPHPGKVGPGLLYIRNARMKPLSMDQATGIERRRYHTSCWDFSAPAFSLRNGVISCIIKSINLDDIKHPLLWSLN